MEPLESSGPRVTALIVDDDVMAREALRLLLQGPEIDVVAVCASAEECLDAMTLAPPQVALVDMRMYGDQYAGVELIGKIRALSPVTACLALTASDRAGDLLPKAFYAGAHGYYHKGYVLGQELPRIVRRLAQGAWELDPAMAARLLRGATESPTTFTPHERDMLGRIAAGDTANTLATAFQERESTIHRSIRNIMGKAQAAHSAKIERRRLDYR